MKAKPSYRETYGYLPAPCVRLVESGPNGEELMLRVVAKLGGSRVNIPVHLTATTVLVQELGAADAETVWRCWRAGDDKSGEIIINVPRMSDAQQRARRAKAVALLATGELTIRQVARRLGVTERAVYGMQAKAQQLGEIAMPQLDLFPAR